MTCKNCRNNELHTRRELAFGVCWQCLATVRKAVMEELHCTPDYSLAFVRDGLKYVPMRQGSRVLALYQLDLV